MSSPSCAIALVNRSVMCPSCATRTVSSTATTRREVQYSPASTRRPVIIWTSVTCPSSVICPSSHNTNKTAETSQPNHFSWPAGDEFLHIRVRHAPHHSPLAVGNRPHFRPPPGLLAARARTPGHNRPFLTAAAKSDRHTGPKRPALAAPHTKHPPGNRDFGRCPPSPQRRPARRGSRLTRPGWRRPRSSAGPGFAPSLFVRPRHARYGPTRPHSPHPAIQNEALFIMC